MKRILKRMFVFMGYQVNKQGGFTFISKLISLTLICVTLPLLVYLIKSASYSSTYEELSARQFLYYLQDEFSHARDYEVINNVIELEVEQGKIATIEKYGTLIRRRVDDKGHEVYLRDVSDVVFHDINYGVKVELITIQGEHYEKEIVFYE